MVTQTEPQRQTMRGAPDVRPDKFIAQSEPAEALSTVADGLSHLGATGVVLAARGGEVFVARALGISDPNGPLTANTLFEIGSCTKQFTAAALLLLADRGAVDLDASVGDYLQGVPNGARDITIRHLLNHTSGVPGDTVIASPSLQDHVDVFFRGATYPPGSHWAYSNEAYSIAAGIIETVSGADYSRFVSEELFRPVGMRTACFTGDPLPEDAAQAVGRSDMGARRALEHPYGRYDWRYKGMGGAVLNVWDLWAWDRSLQACAILSHRGQAELFTAALDGSALGWIVGASRGRAVQYHTGGIRGFTSILARYPEDDGALFVLLNDNHLDPRGLGGLFEAALFGRAPPPPPRPLTPAMQNSLTGIYVDSRGGEFALEADGSLTRARRVQGGKRSFPAPDIGYVGTTDSGSLVLFEWRAQTSLSGTFEADSTPFQIVAGANEQLSLQFDKWIAVRK